MAKPLFRLTEAMPIRSSELSHLGAGILKLEIISLSYIRGLLWLK